MKLKRLIATSIAALSTFCFVGHVFADGMDDPLRAAYFNVFQGKKIAFVPVTMGIDLTEGWASELRKQAKSLGMTLEIRDPHFSADAGAQAITALISEKPDVMIVHNPDVQSYSRLLKRAEQAGIHVIQVNMRSNYSSDAYVGGDWIASGEAQANSILQKCGAGTSGKVAIMQGVPTSGSDSAMMKGVDNILSKHPEINVVANQGTDWDATKERAIMSTVLQQNPDLCGVIGFWDVMDLGGAAAIKESGKKVFFVTSGGGEKMACDNIATGMFDEEISYQVMKQGRTLNDIVAVLLQSKQSAGEHQMTFYTPLVSITKDNLKPDSCWSAADLNK